MSVSGAQLLNIYWFFGCVQKTELAENFVNRKLAQVTDVAKGGTKVVLNTAGVDVDKLEKKLEKQLDKRLKKNRPLADEHKPPLVDGNDGSDGEQVIGASSDGRTPGALGPPVGQVAGVRASGADWVDAVDAAPSVEEGMRRLHAADPMAFYLYGDQIRRALEYKLALGRRPQGEPSAPAHLGRTSDAKLPASAMQASDNPQQVASRWLSPRMSDAAMSDDGEDDASLSRRARSLDRVDSKESGRGTRTRRRVRVTEEDSSRAVLEPSTGLGVMPTKHAETTAARERAKANARNPAGRDCCSARWRSPVCCWAAVAEEMVEAEAAAEQPSRMRA